MLIWRPRRYTRTYPLISLRRFLKRTIPRPSCFSFFYSLTPLPMKVQMQSVHFDADQKLLDFIQKRLDKLETFYDRVTEGEVIMRLNNKDGIANKTVEIKVLVPGT